MSEFLGVQLNEAVKSAATVAVLRQYAKYLVRSGQVSSCEAVKEKLGKVCSAALNRGDMTQDQIDEVFNGLDKSNLFMRQVAGRQFKDNFIDKSLVRGILRSQFNVNAGEDTALLAEAKEAMEHLIVVANKIKAKYGDLFMGHCENFYKAYKPLLEPGFEQMTCALFDSVPGEYNTSFVKIVKP